VLSVVAKKGAARTVCAPAQSGGGVADVINSGVLPKLPTSIKTPSPEDVDKLVMPMWFVAIGSAPKCAVAVALT